MEHEAHWAIPDSVEHLAFESSVENADEQVGPLADILADPQWLPALQSLHVRSWFETDVLDYDVPRLHANAIRRHVELSVTNFAT